MGFCTGRNRVTGREVLCCDFCDDFRGSSYETTNLRVTKIRCPYGYCQAWATCDNCRKAGKHKAVASCGFGTEEENKNHTGCKIWAEKSEQERQERNKLLQAGKWLRVAALSHDECTKVIFRDAQNRERAFFMAAGTYHSIPLGVDASIEDYAAKGSIVETSNLNLYGER